MNALIYQPNHKWRFGGAIAAAVIIHCAALGLANVRHTPPPPVAGTNFTEIDFLEPLTPEDAPLENIEPLPTPPVIDPTFIEQVSTPPPRKQTAIATPVTRPPSNAAPRSMNLSSAKVLAVNAPRPEYPYEARRQRITGNGIAVMTIDRGTGSVINVSMAKSTGNSFLDNAALTGFRRCVSSPARFRQLPAL